MSEVIMLKCDMCMAAFHDQSFLIAEMDGWQEREYGHICPSCVLDEQAQIEADEREQAISIVGLGHPEETVNDPDAFKIYEHAQPDMRPEPKEE